MGPHGCQPKPYVARTRGLAQTIFNALSSVQILVYDYDDENDIVLEGHRWEPCSTAAL